MSVILDHIHKNTTKILVYLVNNSNGHLSLNFPGRVLFIKLG